MDFAERRDKALALIQRVHEGQTRADGSVPAWHHLDRVSLLLRLVLEASGEGTDEEREDIALAGLGHDAVEDTEVTEEELREAFGERGVALIMGMTNRLGDDEDVAPYVRQVAAAEEGVRLIKLADLYDNCTSVLYDLFVLKPQWAEGWFLPIVEPMIAAVLPTTFTRFPAAAERLKAMVRSSHAMLKNECVRYKERGVV
ncbi:MAG TPA: HD domain-containing protein [Candidatus Binatia bacterium]|jgi:(p)ppGpp synthase/HD superfamily hydrolase|nr:HD domain-containing protein [Candidatus Binatia bacterium]